MRYRTSTCSLSTSSSRRRLKIVRRRKGCLILGWASHLDAFSAYPHQT